MDGTGFDEKTENGPSDNKQDKNKGSSKDISEEDDIEVEESKGLRQTEKEGSIWLRLKRDKLYREKYILTMAYFLSFLMLVCFYVQILFVNLKLMVFDLQKNNNTKKGGFHIKCMLKL